MQFALDELPMTVSNINMNSISSSSMSSFSLSYAKFSSSGAGNSNFSSSQYADLTKLYSVVSTLLRCYDISSHCQSASQVIKPLRVILAPLKLMVYSKIVRPSLRTDSTRTVTLASLGSKRRHPRRPRRLPIATPVSRRHRRLLNRPHQALTQLNPRFPANLPKCSSNGPII